MSAAASTTRACRRWARACGCGRRSPVGTYPPQVRPILVAMQRYGMLLADNGPDWHVSGAPSAYWNDQALKTLGQVKGSDFEVVRTVAPAS